MHWSPRRAGTCGRQEFTKVAEAETVAAAAADAEAAAPEVAVGDAAMHGTGTHSGASMSECCALRRARSVSTASTAASARIRAGLENTTGMGSGAYFMQQKQ